MHETGYLSIVITSYSIHYTKLYELHAIKERPIAIGGEIKIRPIMYLALTYDHRIIDGREAVTFLKGIKERIENPYKLLLEI